MVGSMDSDKNRQCLTTLAADNYINAWARANNITDQKQLSLIRAKLITTPFFKNFTSDYSNKIMKKKFYPPQLDLQTLTNVLIALAVLITFVNLYIFGLFLRKKQLRKKSNLFLISLCLSDLLVGIFGLPLTILYFKARINLTLSRFSEFAILATLADASYVMNGLLSCLNLFCVIGDRYLLLYHPFIYQTVVSKKKILGIIISLWMVSVILSMIPVIWSQDFYLSKFTVCDMIYGSNETKSLMNNTLRFHLSLFCIFSILVFIKCIFFARIIMLIIRTRNSGSQRSSFTDIARELKAIALIFFMFICLLFWFTPFMYFQVITFDYSENSAKENNNNDDEMDSLTKNLKLFYQLSVGRFLASIVNPILYIMYKLDIHKSICQDKDNILAFITRPHRIFRAGTQKQRNSRRKTTELDATFRESKKTGETSV